MNEHDYRCENNTAKRAKYAKQLKAIIDFMRLYFVIYYHVK